MFRQYQYRCTTIILIISLFCFDDFVCASNVPLHVKPIEIGDALLEYRVYRDSIPGEFLFGLVEHSKAWIGKSTPSNAHLVVLSDKGTVKFRRTFKNKFQSVAIGEFKKLDRNLYGYFLTEMQEKRSPLSEEVWYTTLNFLDSEFHDVFLQAISIPEVDLSAAEVVRRQNGNIFLFTSPENYKKFAIDSEIYEFNPKGQIVFHWNGSKLYEAYRKFGEKDYIHLNSLQIESDGNLLVSFYNPSEIAQINYPSAKLSWRIGSRGWKFINDSQNGFYHQHSVQRLANGNILMFDVGDEAKSAVSRAVEYQVNLKSKIARLVWEYRSQEPMFNNRAHMGSVKRLTNGNTLIGWGGVDERYPSISQEWLPVFSEVDLQGHLIRELRAKGDWTSYRVNFVELTQ